MITQTHDLDLSALLELTEAERLDARDLARDNAVKRLGPKPDRSMYQDRTASRFPPYVIATVSSITIILILAFFAISAMRLYTIGSHTFGENISFTAPKIIAGIAIVIGSETGALGFMLAAGVLAQGRRERNIFYALAFASTLIALVGNAQFALGGNWRGMITSNPFAVIEAIFPPVVVLGGALVIERLWLTDIARQHANEQAYQDDLADWKHAVDHIEDTADFKTVYMHALKKILVDVNSSGRGQKERREIMAGMNGYHWRVMVERELKADDWTALNTPQHALTMGAVHPTIPFAQTPVAAIPAMHNGNGNGQH